MNPTTDHYDSHLAETYAWMCGGLDAALQAGREELAWWAIPSRAGDLVVDLGCGFGKHAIPLLEAGARVHAVDTSRVMLALLQGACGSHPALRIEHADLAAALRRHQAGCAAILCLGDTLTHLPSPGVVEHILQSCARALSPGGRLALSFRDYTTAAVGEVREIEVRADSRRRVHCTLAYSKAHVDVTDVICEQGPQAWSTRSHSYRKLRIAPDSVARMLHDAGLHVERLPDSAGMIRIAAWNLGDRRARPGAHA